MNTPTPLRSWKALPRWNRRLIKGFVALAICLIFPKIGLLALVMGGFVVAAKLGLLSNGNVQRMGRAAGGGGNFHIPQPQPFRLDNGGTNHGGVVPTPASNWGHGSNGIASTPTFPVGSQHSATPTFHPSTGQQNSTRHFDGGVYTGSYDSSGAYFYDPDGKAVTR